MLPALDTTRPIFLQIKEAIEGDILGGLLTPDEQIPSNSQLVSFFGVNPVTVHRGVSLLFEEGIVYKKRGLGMFVSPKAPALLRKRERDNFERDFVVPLARQATLLGIDRDTLHTCIDKRWAEAERNAGRNAEQNVEQNAKQDAEQIKKEKNGHD
ncbi:MAG: GntR family transcriptional regulator [Coriobacteriales bacterium]|jgi:DNA-binding transcriptional regulator YhcF (GntR family)|nr:GntR family transcriptional regulator [Coriobacteriales bacterium]